jgi:hypothetical protein
MGGDRGYWVANVLAWARLNLNPHPLEAKGCGTQMPGASAIEVADMGRSGAAPVHECGAGGEGHGARHRKCGFGGGFWVCDMMGVYRRGEKVGWLCGLRLAPRSRKLERLDAGT